MREKKGQIEISFNWIFILLAGGAILVFFIFVIFKETGSTEEIIDLKLAKRMDALLSAVEQNPSSIKDIGDYTTLLQFDCNDDLQHEFYLENSKSRHLLETQLIFSPRRVGGSKIYSWTLDFDAPYPVASMLLLSDERTMYIFETNPNPDFTLIFNKFPQEFVKNRLSMTAINNMEDQGFRKYVIITTDPQSINLQTALRVGDKTSIVHVPSGQIEKGELVFYEYEHSVPTASPVEIGRANFVTTELLYAAIISGDPDLYKCGVRKVMERTKLADNVNEIRMGKLHDIYVGAIYSICSIFYGDAQTDIQLKRAAIEDISNFHTEAGRNEFYIRMQELKTANTEMLSASCPLMY